MIWPGFVPLWNTTTLSLTIFFVFGKIAALTSEVVASTLATEVDAGALLTFFFTGSEDDNVPSGEEVAMVSSSSKPTGTSE